MWRCVRISQGLETHRKESIYIHTQTLTDGLTASLAMMSYFIFDF